MAMILTQGRVSARNSSQGEEGFTLVELMVVVAIIAILASIGIPKMVAFVKTAETAEAVEQMGKISKAIRGYVDSRPSAVVADLVTALGTNNTLGRTTASTASLTTLIPSLTIADNAKFAYRLLNVAITATRAITFCIKAHASITDYAAGTVASVYYTETAPTGTAATIWEGQIFRTGYIDGTTALSEGGDCTTAAAGDL